MSSMLLARTSRRLKQLITSTSSSKKGTNQEECTPTLSPASGQASPANPRRSSRPHSWISHTSTRKSDASYPEAATLEPPTPRIEPPAIPNAVKGKGRTKSAGNVGSAQRPANEFGEGNEGCHAPIQSRSESSLCTIPALSNQCCDGGHGYHASQPHGAEESDASFGKNVSLSGHQAHQHSEPSTPGSTSCRDAACHLKVPRKSSRRKKVAANSPVSPGTQIQGSLELFPSPPTGTITSGILPGRTPSSSYGSRTGGLNSNSTSTRQTRAPQLSTLDLLEALELDPEEVDKTPTQNEHKHSTEEDHDESEERDLPLTRTAWSDDVEQLIRETDKAFKAASFALSDAKSATGVQSFRAINWRPDIHHTTQNESGSESAKKAASMRMRGKQAVKTPLARNASIKATKPKSKKQKNGSRKVALQAFPTTTQNPSPRWTLPEVTAELFGGRMFGRLEADEMLKTEECVQRARLNRESREIASSERERMLEERKRDSMHSQNTTTSTETRDEGRSTPVEPFHLEELSSRLSSIKVTETNGDFETPRPSPKPPIAAQYTTRSTERFSDLELSQPSQLNTVLPPIPIHSPISPPTPSTFAVFNVTAPLPPVSAISPPLDTFQDNGFPDQDPLRFGRLKFPSPPVAAVPSQPQPIPHRTSRSRSGTRTSLATILETSPADPHTITHSQSMPVTPAKNRSPIRSPPSTGTVVGATPSPEGVQAGPNNAALKSTTLLHSALNRDFKQHSNSQSILASTEVISGSLSPRKVTPFVHSTPSPIANTGLVSTPFSLTTPLFKHGSIRLNRSQHSHSFPGSGNATPHYAMGIEGADDPQAQVMPLDWTAFQMAISGGAGEYLMGTEIKENSKEQKEEEEEREREDREDLFEWWREFGFKGRDGGMGRVLRGEPRKTRKGEKKRKKEKNLAVVVTELPGEDKPRPFSFLPGPEDLTSSKEAAKAESGTAMKDESYAKQEESGSGRGNSSEDKGYEFDDSLPDSPMEEISEEALKEERALLMGFNLGHDLHDFLRWESFNEGYTYTEQHRVAPMDRVRSI